MPERPRLSLIVPVRADEAAARRLVGSLPRDRRVEVILVDGGGNENLAAVAAGRPDVRVIASPAGRALQMNAGAASARGDWLVFLHADSALPRDWVSLFERATGGADGGWFQFALDARAWQARVIEYGVRWRVRWLRLPYGDQGLFARRAIFAALGGYRPLPLMEDVDFVRRLCRHGRVVEVPVAVTTSARRWQAEGWLSRTLRNLALIALYFAGVDPGRLAAWYAPRRPR